MAAGLRAVLGRARAVFREPRHLPAQDPWVVPFEGELLLVQSTDDDRRIVLRRLPSLDRIHDVQDLVVWDPRGRGDHAEQLWAPELHRLDARWYLYVAASDGANRNHRTYVLEADHPFGPYRERGRLADPAVDRWSIDCTVLEHDGRRYAIWSGWEGDGAGGDEPQHLYIAPLENPWTLAGPRVRLSSPDLPWERSVAPINEGPQVLRRPDGSGLFVVFSADASWTNAYKLGALEWTGGDPLDPAAWHKLPDPLLVGGGHGCFLDTDHGQVLVFHRKLHHEDGWADRVLAVAPVAWDAEGRPRFGARLR